MLAEWSGLGYYRRARFLHRAAQNIVEQGGKFPDTYERLLELPGVGDYTAAAVASIAFDRVVPVVDGNVERFAARRLALALDPKSAAGKREVRAHARSLLVESAPGESNQAMMELGATICRPTQAECVHCPLSSGCQARESSSVLAYPVRAKSRRTKRARFVVVVVLEGDAVLLFRRPENEQLLAGMWELPFVEMEPRNVRSKKLLKDGKRGDETQDLEHAASLLAERYGGVWRLTSTGTSLRHAITHRVIELQLVTSQHRVGHADTIAESQFHSQREGRYVPLENLATIPTSSMVEKSLAALDLLKTSESS